MQLVWVVLQVIQFKRITMITVTREKEEFIRAFEEGKGRMLKWTESGVILGHHWEKTPRLLCNTTKTGQELTFCPSWDLFSRKGSQCWQEVKVTGQVMIVRPLLLFGRMDQQRNLRDRRVHQSRSMAILAAFK